MHRYRNPTTGRTITTAERLTDAEERELGLERDTGILQNGATLRVPMLALDSVQREIRMFTDSLPSTRQTTEASHMQLDARRATADAAYRKSVDNLNGWRDAPQPPVGAVQHPSAPHVMSDAQRAAEESYQRSKNLNGAR